MTDKLFHAGTWGEISTDSLVRDYGQMVSSLCRRMIQDPDLAQDASQQVWLAVIKALPGFRGEAKISTWIYTITRRIVLDYAKKERLYSTEFLHGYFRSGDMNLPDYPDFNKDDWVREMCDKCLTGMLHCLDNESRLIYTFKDIVQLSYKEIAEILETEEPAIRQIVSRTRKKLRNFLKNECALYNPQGTCHCRMKKWVEEINLPQQYDKLRSLARSMNLFLASETVLPGKNYWLSMV
jgi:RNA polymerase sigma-70 factor (ECF subfamily)